MIAENIWRTAERSPPGLRGVHQEGNLGTSPMLPNYHVPCSPKRCLGLAPGWPEKVSQEPPIYVDAAANGEQGNANQKHICGGKLSSAATHPYQHH